MADRAVALEEAAVLLGALGEVVQPAAAVALDADAVVGDAERERRGARRP